MSPERNFSRIDSFLLQKIWTAIGKPPVRLLLDDGQSASPPIERPVADFQIRDRRTLLQLLLDPELAFGEGYCSRRITVRGNLVDALEAVYRAMPAKSYASWYAKLRSRWMELRQQNSLPGARKNIRRHYDLGNSFFRLWLDKQLVYSCAYFPSEFTTLEEAQIAKMDYICRKLQLRADERVVDIGGGWGALAFHMARHFGARVRAFNISREQVNWARARASELGLSSQIEFIEDDYRNIAGKCDALVSVGMLEHVGPGHYRDMGKVLNRVLEKDGRGFLQTIGHNRPMAFGTWTRARIFPGTYAPSIGQMTEMFEPSGFSILDVENLRPHYAKTLEHWLARFEKSAREVSEMYGEEFTRAWRLYLSGSIAGFRAGNLQLFQVLFARPAWKRMPLTRASLYRAEQPETREEALHYAVN